MKYSAALCRPSDGETSMNDFDNEILPTDPDEGEEITERVAGRETYEWVRSLVGAVLVITLLFTPVYYCVIDDLTHRRERRKAKKLAAAQSEP